VYSLFVKFEIVVKTTPPNYTAHVTGLPPFCYRYVNSGIFSGSAAMQPPPNMIDQVQGKEIRYSP
jgi:hypothetical protein